MAETTEDVYVDLFSNSSLQLYPNNRVSSFKVKLEKPLSLSSTLNYECALAQMICPATTQNKPLTGKIVLITFPTTDLEKIEGTLASKVIPFEDANQRKIIHQPRAESHYFGDQYRPPVGGYKSYKFYAYTFTLPTDLFLNNEISILDYISTRLTTDKLKEEGNAAFADIITSRKLTSKIYQKAVDPIFINLDNDGVLNIFIRDGDLKLGISGDLAKTLGFDIPDNEWLLFDGASNYVFQGHKFDPNAAKPSMLSVYTNVILPHLVGDTQAPLIRACTIPKKSTGPLGEFLNFEFETLHYLPVAFKYIQEIQVDVRGNDGQLIPFQSGVLYLRLHFRLKRQRERSLL